MKKKIVTSLLITCIVFVMVACGLSEQAEEKSAQIENVVQYSRISTSELKALMGEPVSIENWTLSSTRGSFAVETYSYDKNSNHYEFIIAEDTVIRLSIYSNKYWNNSGNPFSYTGDIQNTCKLFGVDINNNTKKTIDNKLTYTLSPVNDKIAEFDVQNINSSNKTFDFVKITYNLNYFD